MICDDQWDLFLYQRNVEDRAHSGMGNILRRRKNCPMLLRSPRVDQVSVWLFPGTQIKLAGFLFVRVLSTWVLSADRLSPYRG